MSYLQSMRSLATAVLLFAVFSGVAQAGQAQPMQPPLTVSFGGFTMTNSNSASGGSASTGAMTLGADYVFSEAPGSLHPSAYVDLLGLGGTLTDHIFGAGFAVRTQGAAYAGVGLGYFSVSITPPAACPVVAGATVPGIIVPTSCPQPTFRGSGAGGKLFGGYSFSRYVRIEIDYHVLPSAGGMSSNASSANLGVRI
jgi:hypothetical protein